MKKSVLLIFLVIVLTIIMSFASIGAEVNFNPDDYTEEQLAEIILRIHNSNTQEGYMYTSDVLIAGQDIPAGHYEFWIEENDVAIGPEIQQHLDEGIDYHCGNTELCIIKWGKEHDDWGDYDYEEFYYDEYGVHKPVTLEEGDYLWTKAYKGINYEGFHMKYFPNRQSGLF